MFDKIKKNQFLFEELVKRDFKKKYKGTILGMVWSILSPLLTVLVLTVVFTKVFSMDNRPEPFIIYIFCGTLVMSFYSECTNGCMRALRANSAIFTKINVPKYMFLFSKALQSFINFILTFAIFLVFCFIYNIKFGFDFFLLIYPMVFLLIFCFGVGMILSAMFVFFKDIEYLYGVFMTLLNYVSAIFYPIEMLGEYKFLFYFNPVYVYIEYFRDIVMTNNIPSLEVHSLCAIYALVFLGIGCLIYKKFNNEFLYYV